ncbi:hypothetical protein ADT35_20035, partial [Yersinia pestis subsp. microtus bv. Talassica]
MKKTFVVTARLTMIALAAITYSHMASAQSSPSSSVTAQQTDFLAQQGLAGKSAEQMVDAID